MKKFIIVLLSVIVLTGCREKDKPVSIIGDWCLTDLTLTRSVIIGSEEVEVYIRFKDDGSFDLWQYLGAGRFHKFTGTWSLTENILTGKYSDGSEWGNIYDVDCKDDELILTATDNSSDIYVYTRTTIPESL